MKIAVTSGHRKTVALAFDRGLPLTDSGETLVVCEGPALNIHGVSQAHLNALGTILGKILTDLLNCMSENRKTRGYANEDRLVLGLPGVSSTRNLEVARKCILDSGWREVSPPNYCVIDDTFAGLIAGAQSTMGICAFAGTGASVYMGTANGETRSYDGVMKLPFKRDGYGPLLGDHGSGFRLGITALERICRNLDCLSRSQPSAIDFDVMKLMEAMSKRTEKDSADPQVDVVAPDESPMQSWFEDLVAERSPEWRSSIASLAEVINSEAMRGNKFAQELVDDSAAEMFRTLEDALRLDDFADLHDATIYCQGGMFRHSVRYLKKVADLLKKAHFSNPVVLCKYTPAVGSLMVAASSNWSIPNDADRDAILLAINSVKPKKHRELLFNITSTGPST